MDSLKVFKEFTQQQKYFFKLKLNFLSLNFRVYVAPLRLENFYFD